MKWGACEPESEEGRRRRRRQRSEQRPGQAPPSSGEGLSQRRPGSTPFSARGLATSRGLVCLFRFLSSPVVQSCKRSWFSSSLSRPGQVAKVGGPGSSVPRAALSPPKPGSAWPRPSWPAARLAPPPAPGLQAKPGWLLPSTRFLKAKKPHLSS